LVQQMRQRPDRGPREPVARAKVISAKVREIGAGKIGSCHFYVDPLTGQFTPQYGSDSDVQ
jgi:hypothetical protein